MNRRDRQHYSTIAGNLHHKTGELAAVVSVLFLVQAVKQALNEDSTTHSLHWTQIEGSQGMSTDHSDYPSPTRLALHTRTGYAQHQNMYSFVITVTLPVFPVLLKCPRFLEAIFCATVIMSGAENESAVQKNSPFNEDSLHCKKVAVMLL